MNNKVYISKSRTDRTNWLTDRIIEEASSGHKCYYLGSKYCYEEILKKLSDKERKDIDLFHIGKEVNPEDSIAKVFTNDLAWETASIFPIARRTMITYNTLWYITINSEGAEFGEESNNKKAN